MSVFAMGFDGSGAHDTSVALEYVYVTNVTGLLCVLGSSSSIIMRDAFCMQAL